MKTIIVPEEITNERCDKVLSQELSLPRSIIKFSFKQTPFLCNGKPISIHEKVKSGDTITFKVHSPPVFQTNDTVSFNIVFEDEDLIIIDKPSGIIIHPAPGIREKTLVEYIRQYCNLSQLGEQERQGIVHRLDKDTTGLIIFAKSNHAFNYLSAGFAKHFIEKCYTCIVQGTPTLNTGKIEVPIAHQNDKIKMVACPHGKSAKTTWTVLERFEHFTWLNVKIHTGRTHQIRVHMNHIGHPIAGDVTYGYKKNSDFTFPRVMLHAETICFIHPRTEKKVSFTAPLPLDFLHTLENIRHNEDEFHKP